MEFRRDGSLLLTLTTSHFLEIKKWILSWGSGARVLEPESLRNEIVTELAQMTQQYHGSNNPK
jgi:predicted DNA-binding transcriptional regulator YafY